VGSKHERRRDPAQHLQGYRVDLFNSLLVEHKLAWMVTRRHVDVAKPVDKDRSTLSNF
jgi:acyl-ACP thioesterase